jgi:hypothetical protein
MYKKIIILLSIFILCRISSTAQIKGNQINCTGQDQITVTVTGEVDLGIFVRNYSKSIDPLYNQITFEISGKSNKIYQVRLDNTGSITQSNGVNITTEWLVSSTTLCNNNTFVNGGIYTFKGSMYVIVKVTYVQVLSSATRGGRNFEQVLTVEYGF